MKKIIFILSIIVIYNNNISAQTPATDLNWDTASFVEGFKYHNYTDFELKCHNALHHFYQGAYMDGYGCSSVYTGTHPNPYKVYSTYDNDSTNLAFDYSGKEVTTIVTKKGPYVPFTSPTSGVLCPDTFNYTTSAFLHPPNWGSQKYGYWEMRYRLPQYTGRASYRDATAGFGANFWLRGDPVTSLPGDTFYSEIDIAEMSGWDNAWSGTLHYHGVNAPNQQDINAYDHGDYVYRTGHYPPEGWPTPLDSIDSLQGYFYPPVNYNTAPANDTGWHKIGMDWEPNYVKWYIDDTLAKFAYYNYSVFNNGMEMIIGLWVPGGSILDKSSDSIIPPSSSFPYNYQIDYVKTYKLITDCSDAYSVCKFDSSTFSYGVKKSIEITGNSCSTDITSGQNVTLRAVDNVKLDKNFKVEKGATFQIIMQPCPN